MTIDEAITHAREVSSRKFDDRVHCIRCSEFHKQLAEWLEELKEYKKNSNTCPMCDTYCSYLAEDFENGYNKAIDDFIHECDKCCGFYTGNNKNLTREDMLNIAEQLKAVDMDEEDFENVCCDGKCRICEKCEEVSDER